MNDSPQITDWKTPPHNPQLAESEIHVWRLSLLSPDGNYQVYNDGLDEDEQKKGARFLFEKHRERFIVGRARLRSLLAQYIGTEPTQITYAYDNLGKPRFAESTFDAEFKFNFSNSNDMGLLAVTRRTEVGVDLEKVRSMSDMLGMANRYFAEVETQQLMALPEAEQPDAFFRCWTRKEAYLKAVGKGLTFPLRDVHVSLGEHELCQVRFINSDADDANLWTLAHLAPADGYHGALAIRDTAIRTIRCYNEPSLVV